MDDDAGTGRWMTYDLAADVTTVPRAAAGTDTGPDTTLAAALAVIEAAHVGEIERLTGIHRAEITRLTEALTRSGLHDALMVVEAKLTAAEQGRAERMLRQGCRRCYGTGVSPRRRYARRGALILCRGAGPAGASPGGQSTDRPYHVAETAAAR